MRIMLITTGSFPHVGGKSSHIQSLIQGFEQIGDNCSVFSYSDIHSHFSTKKNLFRLLLSPMRIISFDSYAWMVEHYEQKLFSRFLLHQDANNFDIILAEDPVAALISNKVFSSKKPIVLTMHSYFGKSMGIIGKKVFSPTTKYYEQVKKEHLSAINVVDLIIGVDDRIKNDCISYIAENGYNSPKVIAIENFVDTEKYCPIENNYSLTDIKRKYGVEGKRIISCIRRLCDKNGVVFAVRAMSYLSDDYVLLVGGDGDCKREIEKEIEESGLQNKVLLLGAVQNDEVLKLYSISDYSLVPSITVNGLQEATSISALEAMSFSIPVIASNIGGLKQIINNRQNGFLVEEQNPKEIAHTITELGLNPELLKTVKTNARKTVVENYSYIAGARRYHDALVGVTNRHELQTQ